VSWIKAELTSVCDLFADGDWIESKDQSDNGIRLIQTGNVGFGKFKARDSKARYVSEETFKRLRCTEIKQGDILVSRLPDPVGRACVIPELDVKSITAVDCTIIRTKNEIISTEFLNYFFQSPQYFEQVEQNITGATRQRISRSLLGKIQVQLPPLSLQQKIVAKLDTIFAEIDKATASTDANAKNAEALFQSYLKQVFNGNSLWIENTLGKCFELYQPKTITTKDLIEDGKYQVYGANGVIGRYDKFNHEESQLLVTCRGATCGAVNVSSPFSWINGNAMVVKPKIKDIDVRFVEYFFRGAVDLTKAITGAAQPQITRQSLSPIIFKYPSLKTQQEIVALLDSLSAEIVKSKNSYKIKAFELTTLKQSILKQAFNGELVKE
jgi:type I restriction enzyme S subunit